jgi:hypothetical protein
MPPQEKIPPQENGHDEKRVSKPVTSKESYAGSTNGHSKEEDVTSQVVGEVVVCCEMTSLDRIQEIAATDETKTETAVSSGEGSSWAAVNTKMTREMSKENDKCCEQRSAPPVSGPVQEEQLAMMDFDDMLPHIGEFGLYQKILFALLAPFAFFVAFVYFTQIFITLTPEGYWCNIPELKNLTAEQR